MAIKISEPCWQGAHAFPERGFSDPYYPLHIILLFFVPMRSQRGAFLILASLLSVGFMVMDWKASLDNYLAYLISPTVRFFAR
jgi:hypothetical protein